jgi:flagellar hook-length control protein FliK
LLPADAVTPAPTFFAGTAANPAKATKTAGQNSAAADAKTFAQHAALADTANAQNAPTLSAEAARHDKLATETAVSAASVTNSVANSVANSVTNSAANSAINAAGLTTHGGNVADNAATVATSDATSPLAAAFLPGAQAIDHHAPLNQVPTITASPNQPGWADDLGQRLTWMIGNHRQQADLVLSPPQLGHLQISLKLDGDQAMASFVSPHPAVRDALENALPRLREVLAQSGVTLGQTHVGSEQRQFANQPQDAAVSRSAASAVAQTYPGGSQVISSTVGIAGSRGSGMVDIFA